MSDVQTVQSAGAVDPIAVVWSVSNERCTRVDALAAPRACNTSTQQRTCSSSAVPQLSANIRCRLREMERGIQSISIGMTTTGTCCIAVHTGLLTNKTVGLLTVAVVLSPYAGPVICS